MKSSIRKASFKDLDLIVSMTKQTIDKCYRDWLDSESLDNCLKSDKLDLYLESSLQHTWLLQTNSNVVAYSICIENMIEFMLVDIKYQGRGIGSQLLHLCESMLFEEYSTLSLENFKLNDKANLFLESNNWEPISEYLDPKINAYKYIFLKKAKKRANINLYSSACL